VKRNFDKGERLAEVLGKTRIKGGKKSLLGRNDEKFETRKGKRNRGVLKGGKEGLVNLENSPPLQLRKKEGNNTFK